MNKVAHDILMHYGVSKLDGAPGRGSGRYPLGSGDNPYQRSMDFLGRVAQMQADGMTQKDIAKALGYSSTTNLRVDLQIARHERDAYEYKQIMDLKEQGLTNQEIADKLGLSGESAVRSKIHKGQVGRSDMAKNAAEFLKEQLKEKGMIDVSAGVEVGLNMTPEKLKEALYLLEEEGYKVQEIYTPQQTNAGKWTRQLVLTDGNTDSSYIYKNLDKVGSMEDYISEDNGTVFRPAFVYPESLDSSRMMVRYAEEGGIDKDGVVELRRGVEDISLGDANYAQVRILVDGTHYIKGMAVYNDDMPEGVDVIFNTNKHEGTPLKGEASNKSVLKPIEKDPDNPFGSLIKEHGGQRYYDDPNGKYIDPITGKRQSLSLINKRAEEGDWGEWTNKLSSQFLAKQDKALISRQLGITIADKQAEFDEIMSYTNPTIKKALLKDFAESCDADAVYLKAAGLPRQRYQVILPVTSLKDTEIFAPNYENGEKVALVRFPHAGQFEIPILTVNNKNKEARQSITTKALDAVGINKKVADQLSGADFDGDTVLVIPTSGNGKNQGVTIRNQRPLEQLIGFDPKESYPEVPGMRLMRDKEKKTDNTQKQMGMISNLITDMTIKGATREELSRAVKHSMVVIDAGKHRLNYKQSEIDNDIASLKKKYQTTVNPDGTLHVGGASTLLSKAKREATTAKTIGTPKINPKTGELEYKTDPVKKQKTHEMLTVKDAYELSSGYEKEALYADYANSMKAMGNQARLAIVNTKDIPYDPRARETYRSEVAELDAKLKTALANQPKERAAQRLTAQEINQKKLAYDDLTKAEIKKMSQQALTRNRELTGASRRDTAIHITPSEWAAIQAGAISKTRLQDIIKYTPSDELRSLAMPKSSSSISEPKQARLKSMSRAGYTNKEIAEALGISVTTVTNYLKSSS